MLNVHRNRPAHQTGFPFIACFAGLADRFHIQPVSLLHRTAHSLLHRRFPSPSSRLHSHSLFHFGRLHSIVYFTSLSDRLHSHGPLHWPIRQATLSQLVSFVHQIGYTLKICSTSPSNRHQSHSLFHWPIWQASLSKHFSLTHRLHSHSLFHWAIWQTSLL